MNDKIGAKHLERAAYVYIRQSTLQQVRQNLESNRRNMRCRTARGSWAFADSAGFWRRSVMVESVPYWQWKHLGLLAITATGTT